MAAAANAFSEPRVSLGSLHSSEVALGVTADPNDVVDRAGEKLRGVRRRHSGASVTGPSATGAAMGGRNWASPYERERVCLRGRGRAMSSSRRVWNPRGSARSRERAGSKRRGTGRASGGPIGTGACGVSIRGIVVESWMGTKLLGLATLKRAGGEVSMRVAATIAMASER